MRIPIDLFEDFQLVRRAETPTLGLFHDLRIRDFPSKITQSLGRRRDGCSHLCLLHHDSMLPRPDSLNLQPRSVSRDIGTGGKAPQRSPDTGLGGIVKHPDGTYISFIQPVIHHGVTPGSYNYALSRHGTNKVDVLRIPNALNGNRLVEAKDVTFSNAWQSPPDAPQLNSEKTVHFSNLGTSVLKGIYRDDNLYFVTQDAGTFGTANNLAAIRLVQLNVSSYNSISITKNRIFGIRNPTTPPATGSDMVGRPLRSTMQGTWSSLGRALG